MGYLNSKMIPMGHVHVGGDIAEKYMPVIHVSIDQRYQKLQAT